jgi:hypothetical protein
MSKKIWNIDINKHQDWEGDESTFGRPVSGEKVQKFIKDSLQARIGYVFDDIDNNLCRAFADREDYILWESNPIEYNDLLICQWTSYHGGTPTPPQTLDYPAYYGSLSTAVTIQTAPERVPALAHTTSMSVVTGTSQQYLYVALYKNYRISKAITANNESLLDDFVKLNGTFVLNDIEYNLYEIYFPGISPNTNVSLSFIK